MTVFRNTVSAVALLCASLAMQTTVPNFGAAWAQTATHELRQTVQNWGTTRTVSAKANETVEVILPDATSIILAPGATTVIDVTADGTVSVTIVTGLVRISGGSRNTSEVITISTIHATLLLSGGAAIFAVGNDGTRTHLLNGEGLTVTAAGTTRRIYRPGFEVSADGGRPTRARRMTVETVVADLVSLSRGLSDGTRPAVTSGTAAPTRRFSNITSGNEAIPEIVLVETPTGPSPLPLDLLPTEVAVVPTSPSAVGFGSEAGSFDLAAAFGATEGSAVDAVGESTSSTAFGFGSARIQDYDTDLYAPTPNVNGRRVATSNGPTTNRVFTTDGYVQTFVDPAGAPSNFVSNSGATALSWFDSLGAYDTFGYTDPNSDLGETGGIEGSFFLGYDTYSESEGVFTANSLHLNSFDGYYRATSGLAPRLPDSDTAPAGTGAFARGIVSGLLNNNRERDNFLLTELTPGIAYNFDLRTGGYFTGSTACIDGTSACDTEEDIDAYFTDLLDTTLPSGTSYEYSGSAESGSSRRAADPAALVRDPTEARRLVFASGDLDGLADDVDGIMGNGMSGFSVDRFHLAGSLDGDLTGGISRLSAGMDFSTGRAFIREAIWTELGTGLTSDQLTDSGFMLAYPTGQLIDRSGAVSSDAVVLHADFGLADTAAGQVSTVSATIGSVEFRYDLRTLSTSSGEIEREFVDGIITAETVGSAKRATEASTSITSTLRSSAAGGGNDNLSDDPGRLGFFVLENYGTLNDDVGGNTTLTGGVETSLGAETTNYAILRVGVGVQSATPTRVGFTGDMIGFATGFIETPGAANSLPVGFATVSTPYAGGNADLPEPNLSFGAADLNTNTFTAELTLGGTRFEFGGVGNSAYVTDSEFGALSTTSGSKLALISGELVSDGLVDKFDSGRLGGGAIPTPRSSDHVKWGFFFGDTVATAGSRSHVQIGSFAAGDRIDIAERVNVSDAVATYSGGAIGNVYDGGSSRLVAGTYTDEFDFRTRRGNSELDFDRRVFTGDSFNPNSSDGGGTFDYTSSLSNGSVNGTVSGRFVNSGGGLSSVSGQRVPGGLVGSFDLTGSGGYRATGTIGASAILARPND